MTLSFLFLSPHLVPGKQLKQLTFEGRFGLEESKLTLNPHKIEVLLSRHPSLLDSSDFR